MAICKSQNEESQNEMNGAIGGEGGGGEYELVIGVRMREMRGIRMGML